MQPELNEKTLVTQTLANTDQHFVGGVKSLSGSEKWLVLSR